MVEQAGSSGWRPPAGAPADATPEAPWGYTREGKPRSRRPRSDKGSNKSGGTRKRGSSSARAQSKSGSQKKLSGAAARSAFKLERWEADRLTEALAFLLRRQFPHLGAWQTPDAKARDHLAEILKRLSKVFPFSHIQGAIRRIVSLTGVAGSGPSAGASPVGDLVQYLAGWYHANPERTLALYSTLVMTGALPPIPGVPLGDIPLPDPDELTPEEHAEVMQGVAMAQAVVNQMMGGGFGEGTGPVSKDMFNDLFNGGNE